MRVSWYGNIDELFKISYLHGQSIYSVNIYLQTSTLGSPIQTHQYRGVLLSFKINSTSPRLTLFCLNGHQAKHSELGDRSTYSEFLRVSEICNEMAGSAFRLAHILLINRTVIAYLVFDTGLFFFLSVNKDMDICFIPTFPPTQKRWLVAIHLPVWLYIIYTK